MIAALFVVRGEILEAACLDRGYESPVRRPELTDAETVAVLRGVIAKAREKGAKL